jgi:type VI protein secretion system component VasA
MIVKTKGIFEQLFKRNLSLDDAVYLSSRLISFIYETVQKLEAQKKIAITELPDGSLKVEGLETVDNVIPEVISEFTEINQKLAEKEKEASRVRVAIQE